MPTLHRSTVFARPAGRFLQTCFLALIAAALPTCSGGGGNSSKTSAVGTVIVKVTDSAGAPVSGAAVALHAGVNPSDPTTDANGEVVIQDTLTGEREASAGKQGYLTATRTIVVVAASVTKVDLAIERRRDVDGPR